MKTKLNLSLLMLLGALVYFFAGNSAYEKRETSEALLNPSTNAGVDKFLLGAYDSGYETDFMYMHDSLDFNIWHKYTGTGYDPTVGKSAPYGWIQSGLAPHDSLNTPLGRYGTDVNNVLKNIKGEGMQALMQRPKIDWLCYGQRSDYQCEPVTSGDLWFYSFNSHETGEVYTDGIGTYGSVAAVSGIHCRHGTDSQGNVVRRLKANTEQCNMTGEFHGDDKCQWIIKPRMRLDSNVVRDFPNTKVCRIILIKQNGTDTLKITDIKAIDFKDGAGNYDGRYLEEYNFSDTNNLNVNSAFGSAWFYKARGENATDPAGYKMDIQVYWYGECDMWIDYVRVDNDVADQLFKGQFETPTKNWFEWEVKTILNTNGNNVSDVPFRYYIELFEFNNIPCMAYVSHKLDSIAYANYTKHITLMALPIPIFYSGHVPWAERNRVWNEGHLKRNYLDKVGTQEVYLGYYPFNSTYLYPEPLPYNTSQTWSRIPNTLPTTDAGGTFAAPVSPASYESWLQLSMDSVPYSFESGYSGSNPRLPSY